MRWIGVGVVLAILSDTAAGPPQSLGLDLQSRKIEALVGEPADLRLVLTNHGSEAVEFAESWLSVEPITLVVDDVPITCVSESYGLPGATNASWTRLNPGDRWTIKIPPFRCLCQGKGEASCDDWLTKPGTYTLRMGVAHRPMKPLGGRSVSTPAGVWEGQITSTAVQIRVVAPTGVDEQVWTWAKETDKSPFSVESMRRFPSSRYTALALYPHINIEVADPAKVRALILQGNFLASDAVPEPSSPDGWASLAGRDLAQWRIKHAESILRDQPKFPYAGQLKLAIGINKLAVGNRESGEAMLKDLAVASGTSEGAWARRFLAADGS